MDFDELDNKLTAWWLEIAPSRQRELLMVPPPLPWLDESMANAGLSVAEVDGFLHDKRRELEVTRDAGLNPKMD